MGNEYQRWPAKVREQHVSLHAFPRVTQWAATWVQKLWAGCLTVDTGWRLEQPSQSSSVSQRPHWPHTVQAANHLFCSLRPNQSFEPNVELRPGRYQQQKCPMAKHRQRRSVEPGSVSWSLFLAESLNHCCLIMKPLLPEFLVEFFGSLISEQVVLYRRHRDILSKANWTNWQLKCVDNFYIWLWNGRTENVLVNTNQWAHFCQQLMS